MTELREVIVPPSRPLYVDCGIGDPNLRLCLACRSHSLGLASIHEDVWDVFGFVPTGDGFVPIVLVEVASCPGSNRMTFATNKEVDLSPI